MCAHEPQSKLGTCEGLSQLVSTHISAVRSCGSGVRNRCRGDGRRQPGQHKPGRLRASERPSRAGNLSHDGRCVSCSRHPGAKALAVSAGRPNGWRELTSKNLGRQKAGSPGRSAARRDLQSPGARPSVILVVDDDALFRKLIALLMRLDGHFVLSAANGHEGLELSRQYPGSIDLVITDVEMPRLNGTDLCAHLLEERPEIRVLVMSAADMSKIVSQNANLPFLSKPFDPGALRARVQAILAAPVQPPMHLLHSGALP